PPPQIYTLSLHDALPICNGPPVVRAPTSNRSTGARIAVDAPRSGLHDSDDGAATVGQEESGLPNPRRPRVPLSAGAWARRIGRGDRKSTRLNSSHVAISY